MPTQQVVRIKKQGRAVVTYRDARGRTKNAVATVVAARPVSPVLSAPAPSGTGGTMAAGTVWYRVSATVGGVEGIACAEQSAVVPGGGTGSVVLTWGAVANATSYQVYGRTQGAELLLVSQAGTTYTDTGAATPSGALPTLANSKVTATTRYSNYGTKSGVANVPQATAMRGSGVRYFVRYGNPAGYPIAPRA